jgi:hypothetical protein
MWEWVKMTSEDIKKKLFDLGADLCGISSIDRFNGAPKGYHPLDILPTCQSVIVFAVRFVSGTLACKSAVPYISDKMDKMAVQFCIDMEKMGVLILEWHSSLLSFDKQSVKKMVCPSGSCTPCFPKDIPDKLELLWLTGSQAGRLFAGDTFYPKIFHIQSYFILGDIFSEMLPFSDNNPDGFSAL